MRVFTLKGEGGTLHVAANSYAHAQAQARARKRDLRRRSVRSQVEIKPGVFALGAAAKAKLGVAIYQAPGVTA